jgi:hypothetical protein
LKKKANIARLALTILPVNAIKHSELINPRMVVIIKMAAMLYSDSPAIIFWQPADAICSTLVNAG